MIKDIMIIPCDECKGSGFIYFGDNDNYDVESCDCEQSKEFDWINK